MRSWVIFISLLKEYGIRKGVKKLKLTNKKIVSETNLLRKNYFLRKNISIISKVPFISFSIHMQICIQNCVLSSLKIPGLVRLSIHKC